VLDRLTRPGGDYELAERKVRGGNVCRVVRRAPRSLVDVVLDARRFEVLDYIRYRGEAYTFGDVIRQTARLAAALERMGVGRGDRVAICMRNCPEWPAAFFAPMALGAVTVSLNGWWSADEMAYGLRDAGARVLIADGGRFGGWSVYVLGNRLHYATNNFGERCRVSSPVALPPGAVTVRADVVRSGEDEGRVRFYVDDQAAGEGVLAPFRYHNFVNEPLDVGRDSQTPVDDAYQAPFVFQGRIIDVVIEARGTQVVDQDTLLEELMGSQ